MTLDWVAIQEKWQKAWAKAGLGNATPSKNKEKFMIIFAYPGISGYPHVGHMRGYSYTDAIARYERLQGKEVLFPVGTHASGNQAISFAMKVRNKDQEWLEYLRRNGCPEKKLKELTTPEKIVEYFNTVFVEDYWKKFGFLCDWERFTCTIYPDYEKFIQWQFKKLQAKNLLVQKPYFATACVNCGPVAVDPSETDISKGGNAEKNEYTLLKFKQGNDFLVAATLRPETIYGQTNLWINPRARYVRVNVEKEQWIMSREAAEKLGYQKDDVTIQEDVDSASLIGKMVEAPGINRNIPILPASFCDPNVGSGIVTSVPGDAPYDYVALRQLQQNEKECQKYGLEPLAIKEIKLIPIIQSSGFGDFPAREIVEKLHIKTLDDPKLGEATADVYKAGFHTGVMRENCGKYAGKRVEEAKELVKAELLQEGTADIFHDLSEEVICRCGGKVIIKRIDDQWFIKYSDPELTERSKEQAREMTIFPQEYAEHLPAVLDWFSDRACARLGNWLGSKFPFDPKWTIEPISDSTLYPAYYIVSKFVNNKMLSVQDLTEEFFDYVFLGRGQGTREWKSVREEFQYFYPLDLNLGGKEHQTVHFPVFLMNHVAILPEEKWPQGIFVNWWVTGKGNKISKSKGGAEPIPQAMAKYGVDAMRLYYAHIGSPHVDVVWDEETVLNYKLALERIHSLVEELRERKERKKQIDEWIISRMHQHLRSINHAMEQYQLRELASITYFTMYDDVRWYLRRGGGHQKTGEDVLSLWLRLMNPITPHLSEELNQSKELVSASSWPELDEKRIILSADAGEDLIRKTVGGMRNVLRLSALEKPKQFTVFIAEQWKYELFTILSKELKVTHQMGEIMRKVLEVEELKMKGKEIAAIVTAVVKDPARLPSLLLSQEQELAVMKDAATFLEQEFGCKIKVALAEKSKQPKAQAAMPGKVGVLVE
ncbi:leucine--tRNA ligase [Candidatus Woesearchaeota archaeon]|nr:leucine--tRNA ligase [Candidatus Woesearchaeota archaeon]